MFLVFIIVIKQGDAGYTAFFTQECSRMRPLKLPLSLLLLLLMAPQILETLYSPALPSISLIYGVTAATAGQTLSVYFMAFAAGVFCWGRCCDHIGRRPTMLLGLVVYIISALLAVVSAPHFSLLLLARLGTAFGAAVGSVVTQTMLRDALNGPALGKQFANMGMALALSPMIGLACGAFLLGYGALTAVFLGQLGLAVVLLLWAIKALPETQPRLRNLQTAPLGQLAKTMLSDKKILCSVFLVCAFNVMVFAYFALAPFMFQHLGLSIGYSGIVLAGGSLLGAALNRLLLSHGVSPLRQIYLASTLALMAGLLLLTLSHSAGLMAAATLIMLAFGLAIPNVLSQALSDYRAVLGSASALFGLAYYGLIALGLNLAVASQSLGHTVLACACLALLAATGLARGQVAPARHRE